MADIKKIATREGYGEALVELGREHDNIVVFDADLAGSTKSGVFGKAFPGRHFNAGIAEADMICAAAGAASMGMVAFGLHTIAVDGHDFDALEAAFAEAKTVKGKPTAIVMTTTKGKGVSFMENNAGWHGKSTNPAEFEVAMTELKAALAELEA